MFIAIIVVVLGMVGSENGSHRCDVLIYAMFFTVVDFATNWSRIEGMPIGCGGCRVGGSMRFCRFVLDLVD